MDYRTKEGSPEDILKHHGIKGMKWGERRREMRSLDRQSLRKDRAERNQQIDAARNRLRSGDLHRDYKAARAEYKAQKNIIGKREAGKVLKSKREALDSEFQLSQQAKSGAETTSVILSTLGGVVLASAAERKY